MKRISFLLMVLAAFTFSVNAQDGLEASRNSINFYLMQPQSWLGNIVQVNVVSAEPSNFVVGNYTVCYECETETPDGRDGGSIHVLVPLWQSKAFFMKYANAGASQTGGEILSARLVVYNWNWGRSIYVLKVEE